MCVLKILICVLALLIVYCKSARILGIVPTPSYSHQVTFQPIWKELSLLGHQVTLMTTDPIKDPTLTNLTEINLHASYDIWNKYIVELTTVNIFHLLILAAKITEEVAHYQLSHPLVQKLINSDSERFDLVMLEYNIMTTYAFAKKFNAPLILITSLDVLSEVRDVMGSTSHPILYPDPLNSVQKDSTLLERVLAVMLKTFYASLIKYYYYPKQQLLQDTYFGKHYPPIEELTKNVSLVLTYSDPIFHGVKPLVPTIVQFGGGTHRTAPKPLPSDLKKILDEAENGFIYFSLGSNAKSKDLPDSTFEVIMAAFGELPYTVLWKFEKDDLPNKPNNVITFKWLPQQDVLRHPKIKLFITQGGLQSTEEAIYDHVPMLGMPMFGDQEYNVGKLVSMRLGLAINHKTMNKEELKTSILEVINNPKYKNKIKKQTELALDQPMTGLEKAIWWTEYVIRHKGTEHLRSPMLDIPFYQYYLLDVIAVFMLVLICLTVIVVCTVKLLLKLILRKKSKVKKTN